MRRVYELPEKLRPRLGKPLGRVFTGEETGGMEFAEMVRKAPMAITVGDRVTETLGGMGRNPEVQVVDGVERRSRREPPDLPFRRLVKVKNPPGTITLSAMGGMRRAFGGTKPVRVLVEGEEDLMAILAVALAPVSSVVFYGQPGVGVVTVKVNGVTKSRSRALLAIMGIREL